jgi:hypothetical protein
MRVLHPRPYLATLLVSTAALAQGAVSPAAFATAEGNAGHSYAFGAVGLDGYLAVHDDMAGRPQTIHSIKLRLDGQQALPSADIHFRVDVLMSTAATTSATISRVFADNHGNDAQWVGQNVDVFLRQPANTLPRRFELTIPLTTPFVFGGQGPLCWEVTMVSQLGTQAFDLDWVSSSSINSRSYELNNGTGCRAFNAGLPAHVSTLHRTDATGRLTGIDVFGANFPPFDFAAMLLGDNQSFSGVPLPFAIPGTAQGLSGLCTLYVGPFVIVPVVTSNIGLVQVPLSMPAVLPNGASLFAQCVGHDELANSARVIASDMVQMNFVAPHAAQPLSSVEYNDATTRTVTRRNAGYVVRFD